MTLGEHITLLRTKNNWSQDDLAARLGVSRQSVSKWETDASIPDLDKLLAMSAVFGVTLDELVKGEKPAQTPPQPETPPQPQIQYVVRDNDRYRSPARTAGVILLCFGFFFMLLLTLMGGLAEGLVVGIPFLLLSLLCFVFKRHAGLWCAWVVVLFADTYLRLFTGANFHGVFTYLRYGNVFSNPFHLVVSAGMLLVLVAMLFLTLRAYRDLHFPLTTRNTVLLLAGWGLYVLMVFGTRRIVHHIAATYFIVWPTLIRDGIALAILLPLLIFTQAAYRTYKKSSQ